MSYWRSLFAFFGSGASDIDSVRMDASTHALEAIEHEHHKIHSGSHFFVIGYQDLSINEVLDFTWLMPDTTKWIHWTWNISTEAETLWQVYETVVATNPLGVAVTPCNNDRNSGVTSGTTMKYELQADLAAANADTNVSGGALMESGIAGERKDGGVASRSHEVILKQDTLYCMRATATVAGYINFSMQWYEHTNRD